MKERKYNLETAKVGDELLESSGANLKVVYVSPTVVVTEFENGSIFMYAKSNHINYLLYEVPLAWLRGDPVYAGDTIYLRKPGIEDSTFIVKGISDGAIQSTQGKYCISINHHKKILESNNEYTLSLTPFTKRIKVNGIDIVAPEKECLELGSGYFIADPTCSKWYFTSSWYSDSGDVEYLQRGLVHLTKDNAVAHAKAMIFAGEKHDEGTCQDFPREDSSKGFLPSETVLVWEKPPTKAKKQGWINVYYDPSSVKDLGDCYGIYLTKEDADESSFSDRTACIQIEWEEVVK